MRSTAPVSSSPAPASSIITLIIPWGVFTRYVLNSASSWPEPLAVLLMIVLSFFSAIICYREYLHIGVGVLPALLDERGKAILGWLIEVCMMATNVFMVWYGVKLVQTTMVPEHRRVPAGSRSASPTCRSPSPARSRCCSSSSAS